MTTIAVCKTEGVMAADTRVVTGGSYYHTTKIFRIGDTLWGTAGSAFPCLAVIEWLKSPKRNPMLLHRAFADYDRDDVLLVGLGPDGICLLNGWGMFETVLLDDKLAIGSGGTAALEAMRSGATAEEAVKRAMSHDECTGGHVQVEYLLPPKLLPKRRKRR